MVRDDRWTASTVLSSDSLSDMMLPRFSTLTRSRPQHKSKHAQKTTYLNRSSAEPSSGVTSTSLSWCTTRICRLASSKKCAVSS